MVGAGLTLLFIWALSQAGMWRPVTRVAFPAKLRMEMELPGVDVLVVTADPEKEPTVEVMNTVVSAMALDYPVGKLTVYLSDDAGSPLTLLAARKAYAFATTCWVPFCRKYNLHCPCPARYFSFSSSNDDGVPEDERIRIKVRRAFVSDDVGHGSQFADTSFVRKCTSLRRRT
ncbi:hypothetical protein PR202_ga00395 [Eleusine coracana subsp. coracana]|uniref:Uncharacterized protein n=1 Tax=Eleusine coracana subsp. coracana TaxID=191504 RepID=A0AAV5BGY2_ELECO|nr:hypothetical protein PR202_ga00395 [Eleusine coracana subsp. coracana]